jgi:alpha-ribazole phosphatase
VNRCASPSPSLVPDLTAPTQPQPQPWAQAWRHPRPIGFEGRCIGRTDLPVDRRKAKRLAHRIRQAARHHGWPQVVHTSPLRRCAEVGRWLRRWGWRHHVDPALLEMDFGRWDGLAWADIPHAEVDAWVADFAGHAPGEGESLQAMLTRVAAWAPCQTPPATLPAASPTSAPFLIVAHAGWMLARQWCANHAEPPLAAAEWPRAPAYGHAWSLGSPRSSTAFRLRG